LKRLFAGCFLIYLVFMNPSPESSSSLPHLHLAVSLVDDRSITLSSYRGRDVAFREGRYYSGHPPGAAFLAAEVYQLFRPLFPARAGGRTLFWLNALMIALVSAPLSALGVAFLFRLLGGMPVGREAILWTVVLAAFGTSAFGYAGAFYKKGLVGPILMIVVYFLWPAPGEGTADAARPRGRGLRFFLVGVLAGFSVVLELSMVFVVFFQAVYLLRKGSLKAELAPFVAGGALMAALLFLYNQTAFGSVFSSGYAFRLHGDGPVYGGFSLWRVWQIIFGLRCGLIVYVPVLLAGLVGAWCAVRERIYSREMLWLIAAPVAAHIVFFAIWSNVYVCAGESLIPRQMAPLFPLVMLPLALGVERFPEKAFRWLAALTLGLGYLGAQSFFVPSQTEPFVYAFKDLIVSLGAGELFSRHLPRALGLQTLLSGSEAGGLSALVENPAHLARLAAVQLVFSAAQFGIVFGIWRVCFRGAFGAPGPTQMTGGGK
jgi:hypothetical protein